jgi:hypothetical protein
MSNDDRKVEAEGTSEVVVEFRGQKFTISRDYADWPLELHEALEDGKDIAAMRAALGDAQWAVIRKMGLKTPDIAELTTAVVKALGFSSVGESPASSD